MVGLLLAAGGCQDDQVVTTTRNLDRPGPIALVCAGRVGDAGVTTGLTASACTADAGADDASPKGTLFGFVANTSRGEVAVFQPGASGEPLVDLDRGSPGFGFIPVGNLPTDLKATGDGCRVVTANHGSCDLALIDVPAVMKISAGELKTPFGGVVSRIIPRTKKGRVLRARPQELFIVPPSAPDKGTAACPGPASYRAYVTFPGCNLLAEIDLATGRIQRGVIIGRDGFYPTEEPNCPVECTIRGDPARVDSGQMDYGTVDMPTPPDTGPPDLGPGGEAPVAPDGGPVDAIAVDAPRDMSPPDAPQDAPPAPDGYAEAAPADAGPALVGGVQPFGLAVTRTGDRIYVSSANAGFISVLDVDATTGAFVGARRIALADGVATARISLSPGSVVRSSTKTDSGVEQYAPRVGQFLYAVALDRSVRVISTDLEQECETNVDLAAIDGGTVPLEQARCFVVGGTQTPPRRVVEQRTGLRFGLRVPQEVTFVTSLASHSDSGIAPNDAGVYTDAGAVPLRGIFALVALSDGTVYVVDVEDWNQVTPAVSSLPLLHLPHRTRNGLQGAAGGKADASVASVTGASSGGVPVVVSELNKSCSQTADCPQGTLCPTEGSDRRCSYPGQGVFLRGIGTTVPSEWSIEYEARLVGRWSGNLVAKTGQLHLSDQGASFCRSGVLSRLKDGGGRSLRHGDIVELIGCTADDECGLDQVCVKPVTQQTEYGLCFDQDRQDELFQRCAAFLRGKRELLVVGAQEDILSLDALPVEPQAVIRQPSQPTDCNRNEDCAATYLCALEDRVVAGRDDLSIDKGKCFRPGCNSDKDCGSGFCVQPLDGGPRVCAPIPLPLELGPACSSDGVCKAKKALPASCETDKDCVDALAECRRTSSQAASKTCVDKNMHCSTYPGLKGKCVRVSPCFNELLRYDVRAGRSFLTGGHRRVIADPTTRECMEDSTQSSLLAQRIPIGPATYPAVAGPLCFEPMTPLVTPVPNPCFERESVGYVGFLDPGTSPPIAVTQPGPATVVRFSNPDIATSLGVNHLTKILATGAPTDAGVGSTSYSNMPQRGLTILLNVGSGYSQMRTATNTVLALPAALADAPDGYVYIVDMGNVSGSAGANGQVRRFVRATLDLDTFIVR